MHGGRLSRLLACATALGLVVVGCGGTDSGDEGGGGGDNSYSIAIGEPDSLIPGNDNEEDGLTVIYATFDGLVRYDPDTGEPINNVAKSIETKDQQTWTITLKQGRTFHNGEEVTAKNFVWAWNYAAYGPHAFVNNYFFGNIKGYDALNPEDPDGDGPKEAPKPETKKMSGLKVVDKYTFKVTLKYPFSQFPLTLGYAAFMPLPKVAFKDMEAFNEHPIGNGPYKMATDWKHNEAIKLTAYEDYKGPRKPQAKTINLKIYTNLSTAYTDLLGGEVDILTTIPAAKVPNAKQQFGDRFISQPSSTMDYLSFPMYMEKYQRQKVRWAISMAINRKAITENIFSGTFTPMNSLLPPIIPGYRENACGKHCEFHPDKAKQLLKEAGGWEGTMYLWFNGSPTNRRWMKAVRNMLKENLGIESIKFRQVSDAEYLTKLANHEANGPARKNWYMDYPSPQNYLQPQFSSEGSSNRNGYSNPKVDKLILKGNSASSKQAARKYYHKAEDLILKDMPITPLWNWREQAAYSENVTNVTIDPYSGLHAWQVKPTG